MTRLERAVALATELHAGQVRKGTSTPYITHPLAVLELVRAAGGSEDERCAAVLHDTAEDCGGTPVLERIAREFGAPVAQLVLGCTALPQTVPWRLKKEMYLMQLADAPEGVKLVASADKLHNARSILTDRAEVGEEIWERFTGGKEGVLWYYRLLSFALRNTFYGLELIAAVAEMNRE